MATKKRQQPTERFEVEWCTHIEIEDGDMVCDLNQYESRFFYSLDKAIAFAKSCRFDLQPVQIRRQVVGEEIVDWVDDSPVHRPRWECDDSGVLIDVMGEEIVDYR